MTFKIGDRIFVRGYIDEIRKDTVIVRNDGGYFGTILSEVTGELPSAQPEIIWCKDCKHWDGVDTCDVIDAPVWDNDFCSMAERRGEQDDESRSNSNAQTDTRARGMGATDKSSGI